MKVRYLKLRNWLILSIMGLLGLSACRSTKEASTVTEDPNVPSQPQPRSEIALMYGVPTMNFVVKGKVTDPQGKPVKGMQVIIANQSVDIDADRIPDDNPYLNRYLESASDTTDANGNYECHVTDTPSKVQRIIVRDIDGAKNGSYQNELFEVEFEQPKGDRPNTWMLGTATSELNIELKKK